MKLKEKSVSSVSGVRSEFVYFVFLFCILYFYFRDLSAEVRGERGERDVSERAPERFGVNDFEIKCGEESQFGRGGTEVVVNECEFVIGIGLEVEEFIGEIVRGGANLSRRFVG